MQKSYRNQFIQWILATLLALGGVAEAAFTITTFTYPASISTRGWQINDGLRAAVTAELSATPGDFVGAVYQYPAGTFTTIPKPAADRTGGTVGINNAGTLTGSSNDFVDGLGPAFTYNCAYSTFS